MSFFVGSCNFSMDLLSKFLNLSNEVRRYQFMVFSSMYTLNAFVKHTPKKYYRTQRFDFYQSGKSYRLF